MKQKNGRNTVYNTSIFQPHKGIRGMLFSKEMNERISAKIKQDHGLSKGDVNYSTTERTVRFSSTGTTIEYTSLVTYTSSWIKRTKELGIYKLTAIFTNDLNTVTFKIEKQA